MQLNPIIGIDLGTTNSCAAVVDEGEARVIEYKGGKFTIPSILAVDAKGNLLVGDEAKRQWQLNPIHTVYGAKRLIGRGYRSWVLDTMKKHFHYQMLEGPESDILVKLRDKDFRLEEISSKILQKIRDVAQDALKREVSQAVVTVPAYFSDRQRQAVKDAGDLIGMEVIRIINEPTAAAMAYGLNRLNEARLIVYDLGGGTFDVSVIDLRNREFRVRATGGDMFLGGIDFDHAVMGHVINEFREKTGIDIGQDMMAMGRLRDIVEMAKIDLSTASETRIHIPFIAMGDSGPINLDTHLSRTQVDQICQELVDRTLNITSRVLAEAGRTPASIDEILLVGGQTRMPLVQHKIKEFFGKPPSKAVHPDEAVAIGAAIYGHSLSEAANFQISLVDVLPMNVGIAAAGGKMHVLFPRNSSIPMEKAIALTNTKDNQRSLSLKIYQGDRDLVNENELLGNFTFKGLRPATRGKVKVEVRFLIDNEGLLRLRAQDKDTGQAMETTIQIASGIAKRHLAPSEAPVEVSADGGQRKPAEASPPASSPPKAPPATKAEPSPPAKLSLWGRILSLLRGKGK